ncbi:DnaD domain protein [Weissella viridescens]|uniref:DnaD domain protein n=2 Tax=Weissella viridescens TaxID=1629 RepID=A0A3P2RCM8_WEIVI|nr:DnaD domain protein [Weissella viridescens]
MGDVSVSTYILTHYQQLGMSNDEFLLYLQLKSQIEHDHDINTSKLAKQLGWSTEKINELIEHMHTKGFANLVSQHDEQGRVATSIDFSPLYDKIMQSNGNYTSTTAGERVASGGAVVAETANNNDQPTRSDIFNMIEQEFGRPLSSMELSTVKDWFDIDHFRPDFIKAALQEAVMNQALSLRYIETILVAWQKKNYHSLNDIYGERKNRQQYKQANTDEMPQVNTDIDIMNIDLNNL